MEVARRWRLEVQERKGGRYWTLRSGRADHRRSLTLGVLSDDDAARAMETMNRDEGEGRGDQVYSWYATHRDDAVSYLVGDPVAQRLLLGQPDHRRMTLHEYYEEVYRTWRAEQTPGGWAHEERVWRRILDQLGSMRVKDLDAHRVADYLDGLVASTGPRAGQRSSGNVQRLHRAALQALLKRAYRLRHIDELPDLAVFRIRGASKTVVEKPDPLTLEELIRLMDASEPRHRAMWAVGAGEGLRPSELVRMRWEDVRWGPGLLDVRGSKTAASKASIPMTPLARRELVRWWTACGEPENGLVFPSRGTEPYQPQGYKAALATAARKAGITRRMYPYLLRDSFATIAWCVGVPMDVARRVLRHTDDRMIQQVYCRPRPEDLVDHVRAFDL